MSGRTWSLLLPAMIEPDQQFLCFCSDFLLWMLCLASLCWIDSQTITEFRRDVFELAVLDTSHHARMSFQDSDLLTVAIMMSFCSVLRTATASYPAQINVLRKAVGLLSGGNGYLRCMIKCRHNPRVHSLLSTPSVRSMARHLLPLINVFPFTLGQCYYPRDLSRNWE